MTSFIDLDSLWRDRDNYPNPCDYEVTPSQIETWFRNAREVRAFPQKVIQRPLEFVSALTIQLLTLPYHTDLASLPRIYIDFHCRKYNDKYLINSIDARQSDARFICVQDRIQYDNNNNPIWIHYRSSMEQTMRFKRDEPVVLRITTRDGTILPYFIDLDLTQPMDPTRQTLVTFSIIPYIRDNDYANHMSETLV
jgi:hypothetical protein